MPSDRAVQENNVMRAFNWKWESRDTIDLWHRSKPFSRLVFFSNVSSSSSYWQRNCRRMTIHGCIFIYLFVCVVFPFFAVIVYCFAHDLHSFLL
jgi:hypothetical protein